MLPTLGDYRSIAAEKKLQRSNKIPKEWLIAPEIFQNTTNVLHVPTTCDVLSDVERKITSDYDATALLEKLRAGIWSAEQVTVAFCKRAAIAQQVVNCLTEIFFDEAIERAKRLDVERRENPSKVLPPLWGLPISLKDCFDIVRQNSSTGIACHVGDLAKENSPLAAMLLDLGAILYCKTNVPQIMMTADSDNNVFGRTLNPHNTALTAGGSTGGEGALIALRGSLLGMGTDIGGSIRIPSLCNGVYGFKPSVGLVPHEGVRNLTVPGTDGIRSSAGPLATSIRDCSLFLKSLVEAETWKYDSSIISIPWRGLPVKKKLRIALVEDDGVYTPSPPVRRGLAKAAHLLRNSNQVEVIPLTLSNAKDHFLDLLLMVSASGSEYFYEQFAQTGEPEVPSLKAMNILSLKGTSLKGFFDLNVRRAAAAKQYLRLFLDNQIDAILMPPAPHTTVPLDTWTSATYTGIFNFLDFPAIVVPVDKVRETDAADDLTNAKYGPDDEKVYSLYTGPELYKDAPVCVQVVGYRHADEALLNIVTVLDSIINSKN